MQWKKNRRTEPTGGTGTAPDPSSWRRVAATESSPTRGDAPPRSAPVQRSTSCLSNDSAQVIPTLLIPFHWWEVLVCATSPKQDPSFSRCSFMERSTAAAGVLEPSICQADPAARCTNTGCKRCAVTAARWRADAPINIFRDRQIDRTTGVRVLFRDELLAGESQCLLGGLATAENKFSHEI